MLAALRLGVHQLLFMDGVADHAAVAESVDLAKDAGSRGHGFVNAVLRRAAREGGAILEALGESTPAEAAVRHSHPVWLADAWWDQLGAESALALMRADNEPAESAARVNTLRATRYGGARRARGGGRCGATRRRISRRASCWTIHTTCMAPTLSGVAR